MGQMKTQRNRHLREEVLMGTRTVMTEGTSINEVDDSNFVFETNCNDCPEDSAGQPVSQGRCQCMCTHFPNEPLLKNGECRRNIVNASKSQNDTGSIPIGVVVGQTNSTSRNGTTDGASDFHGQVGSSTLAHTLQITLLFTLVLVCFLAIIFVGFCIIRRRSFKCLTRFNAHNRIELKSAASASGRLLPDRFINNPTYETTCLDLSIRIYTSDEVTLLTQIGQGCFGKVFKGDVQGEIMAVKMVRSEHASEAFREIETMASFSHPNILPLLGISKSTEAESPWLLFEFMEHGDLASVLRNSSLRRLSREDRDVKVVPSNSLETGENGSADEERSQFHLTHDLLSNIAMQIAEGMKYLSFQHFVHRDLAARNCLVSSTGTVKISDFGLSRDVYTCDYYKIGGSKLLPIRWMAPESILYGCFTLESDVWAYGTVLWEIYTWGKQPYFGHSNEEVVQLILDGVLLCPPSDCPPLIQEIMAGCWKTESKDRLNFRQICEKFVKANGGVRVRSAESDIDGELKQVSVRTEGLQRSSQGFLMDSMESEYEIPRPANHIEYLEVV